MTSVKVTVKEQDNPSVDRAKHLEGHGDQSYDRNCTRLAHKHPKGDRGTFLSSHVRVVFNHDGDLWEHNNEDKL